MAEVQIILTITSLVDVKRNKISNLSQNKQFSVLYNFIFYVKILLLNPSLAFHFLNLASFSSFNSKELKKP